MKQFASYLHKIDIIFSKYNWIIIMVAEYQWAITRILERIISYVHILLYLTHVTFIVHTTRSIIFICAYIYKL